MEKQNFDKSILNTYRFIVSSGCSYGRIAEFTFNAFRGSYKSDFLYSQYNKNWMELEENIIVLSPSLGSQGSDWQADSTIHMCDTLLNMGVFPENIYVIIEWSQWHRFSVHPFNYINLDLNKLSFNSRSDFYIDIINKENQLDAGFNRDFLYDLWKTIGITKSDKFSIPKINNRIYVSPDHMPIEAFKELGPEYEYFINEAQKAERALPMENKLKIYVNNMLKTQFFLESKKIKHNFFFMQSTLSGWNRDGEGMLKDSFMRDLKFKQNYNHKTKQIIVNDNYNPINNSNEDLEIAAPELANDIKMLNFDNIWFYENEKYRRGGIDEWTIDTFKECGYVRLNGESETKISNHDIICSYGAHPGPTAYTLLWNKVATNCDFAKLKPDFEEFMYEKYFEDYNSNEFSKNGLTISKQKWYEISGTKKNNKYL